MAECKMRVYSNVDLQQMCHQIHQYERNLAASVHGHSLRHISKLYWVYKRASMEEWISAPQQTPQNEGVSSGLVCTSFPPLNRNLRFHGAFYRSIPTLEQTENNTFHLRCLLHFPAALTKPQVCFLFLLCSIHVVVPMVNSFFACTDPNCCPACFAVHVCRL